MNQLYSLTTQEQLGVPIPRAEITGTGSAPRVLVWVLVCGNYAGNDELEPAVRVRLVMPKERYTALKKAVAGGDWVAPGPALRGYLFHFGYLVLPS